MVALKVTLLAVAIVLASASAAALPEAGALSDPNCGVGSGGCAIGADAAAMTAVDRAADDQAASEERPIDAPFGKAWLGAADADVTLIVFADYACSHCRDAQPVIDQLVAADPRLKVVYRILIAEDNGRDAAMISLAVALSPGASWTKFHRALDAGGDPTPATIAAALKQAGINPKSLPDLSPDALVGSPIIAELSRNDRQVTERNATGIPAWVIGDGKATAGIELTAVQTAVAAARTGQKSETK